LKSPSTRESGHLTLVAGAIIISAVAVLGSLFFTPELRPAETVTQSTMLTSTSTSTVTFTVSVSSATSSYYSGPTVAYGFISFSSSWRYVGNATMSGFLAAPCALGLHCPEGASSQAEEFTNGTLVIYAEQWTTDANYTILVSNNAVLCITPPVSLAPSCPLLIDGP